MATTTVNATYQGVVSNSGTINFDWVTDIRNAPTGNNADTYTSETTNTTAIRVLSISGRGGNSGSCHRTFLFFESLNTAVGGGTITAATLKVYNGGSSSNIQTKVAKSDAWGGDGSDGTLNTGDYSLVSFTTEYSPKKVGWNGSAYNDFELDSNAITFMNSAGYLNCAVVEFEYDYDGAEPIADFEDSATVEFLDSTNPIKLEITFTPAPTGYLNKVIGVAPASIGKVIGVSSANISKVIGVS